MSEPEDLRRLAASLFVVGFPGLEAPGVTLRLVEDGVAGVIYFARNAQNAEQVARLSATLLDRARPRQLLIAADEEGGLVSRLPRGPARMPGAMALGAAGDPALARQAAAATAGQLRAVGINVDLAPVLDLGGRDSAIGTRSFAADPDAVAALGAAWIQGLQDGGVLAVAKHFPGLGTTPVDSHLARPVLAPPEVSLVPFRAAIGVGVAAVMVAHAAIPDLDPSGEPASRSRPVVEGLLRGRMGFGGLVMTDCLEMQGATADVTVSEAAVRAVAAGADLVLISHRPDLQVAAVDAVATALAEGRLSIERARAAAERVAAAVRRFGLAGRGNPDPDAAPFLLDRPSDRALAREVAERALTCVRAGALPSDGDICVVSRGVPGLAEALGVSTAAPANGQTVVVGLGRSPAPDLLQSFPGHELYVWCISPAVAAAALAAGARAVWVGYDDAPASVGVAADALWGRLSGTGRLPVSL